MKKKDKDNEKKLPCGNSNFKDIILNNYAYIDKTQYIELLEKEASHTKFIVRPPGFGKSLFISMLESYYDIKQKDDFERLFGGLYIGQHPTSERNSYAILKFNFRDVDSFDSENFRKSFLQNIQKTVCQFLENYQDYIPEFERKRRRIRNEDDDGINTLETAINLITDKDKLRIYLLIDEYDGFARHLVATGKYSRKEEDEKYEIYLTIRNFYLRIKTHLYSTIYRTFITGVSYAAWSAPTEGNLTIGDISDDFSYNEIMGFTEEELQKLLHEIDYSLSDYSQGVADQRYGGYLFNKKADKKVYVPGALIEFVQSKKKDYMEPDILNENQIANYTQLQGLIQNEKTYKTILEISKNNKISRPRDYKYLMETLTNEDHLVSLLLNLGLLTDDNSDNNNDFRETLKTPNYFARCIMNYFVYAKRSSKHPEKIIFLDIDGVLQPYDSQDRFKHLKEVDEFNSRLLEEYGVDYRGYNYYDVLAVYYDWDKDAVAELKRILNATDAKIVLSSDWRDKTIFRMVDLCKIHDLDEYIIGATTKEDISNIIAANPKYKQMRSFRSVEILMYVADHPEIKNYVAIDDMNLTPDLGEEHTVITCNKMTTEDADKCIELLNVKH
ncbi:MAG: AAA family ATPase [Planctomycetaceae bacterium]|nr:AAA family ATPase [Planctomycetaceae bacterium]